MKTILLLYHGSGSTKPRLQNVADSKVTQHPTEGTPGCSCDRWGHPFPDCIEHNLPGLNMFIADAHRDYGKRFVVRTDEKLTTL